MSSPGGSAASIWIDGNVALFVVLVVAAVLLLVIVVTLAIYCCFCREKIDHWKRERAESKSTNSHVMNVGLHGDSLDGSAVTANVRGPGTFEVHIEHEQRQKPQQTAPQDTEPQLAQEKVVGVEEVQIQYDAKQEAQLQLPEIKAKAKVEKPKQPDQMEIILQAGSQKQEQKQQQKHAIEFRKNQRRSRNIYESGINEITIVDSDFSDYEESVRDEEKKKQSVLNSVSKIGWQLLPNQSIQPVTSSAKEEPEIFAIDRNGQAYVPQPEPTIEQMRMQRMDNLAELDRTFDVFEQQAAETRASGSGVQVEVKLDTDVVEELVQPIDRSQVRH